MFNNLIESSSHTREIKRRGSFMLFTAVTYVLFFAIAGVVSIYAYDAQLEDPNTEIVVMLPPIDLDSSQPSRPVRNSAPPKGNNSDHGMAERRNPTASVNTPQVIPEKTSATPNTAPAVPDSGIWRGSNRDFTPGDIAGVPGSDGKPGGITTGNRQVAIEGEPPAPEVITKTVPRVISKGVITSQAILLPKPTYPAMARQARIQGVVSVQVLIDESGKVVSAKTISGHQLLAAAAQQAAYGARFSPTTLSGHAMKVSGVITYNFFLQ